MDPDEKDLAEQRSNRRKTNKYQRIVKSFNNALVALLVLLGFELVIKRPRKMHAPKTVPCFDVVRVRYDNVDLFVFSQDFEKLDVRARRAVELNVFEMLLRTQIARGITIRDKNGPLEPCDVNAILERFCDESTGYGFPITFTANTTVTSDAPPRRHLAITYCGFEINDENVVEVGNTVRICVEDALRRDESETTISSSAVDFTRFAMYFNAGYNDPRVGACLLSHGSCPQQDGATFEIVLVQAETIQQLPLFQPVMDAPAPSARLF